MEVKEGVIGKIEEDYGLRIKYSSIYPSFFKKIIIRDITVYNAENNEKLAYFSVIHLEYRLAELLKKNPIAFFSKIKISDGDVNFDTIRNKNLITKIKTMEESDDSEDLTVDESSVNDVMRAFEQELQNMKSNIKPLEVSLKNILLKASTENTKLNFYVSDGRVNLDAEKADFNLNSKFVHVNDKLINSNGKLNIAGSLYRKNFSAFSLVNFSDLNVGEFSIKNISLFLSYFDNIVSINTLQDVYPIDVNARWDLSTDIASLNVECKDFLPFSMLRSIDEGLDKFAGISVSGKISAELKKDDDFEWLTNLSVFVPSFQLGGANYKKTSIKLNADGDNDLLSLNSLLINGNEIKASALGSYNIEKSLPDFSFNVKRMQLPSGQNLSAFMRVSSKANNIFAYIPTLKIGSASLDKILLRVEKKTTKSDFYISAKDESGEIRFDGTWTHSDQEDLNDASDKSSLGYFECHGTLDSLSIDNTLKAVDASMPKGLNLSKGVHDFLKPVKATSEFYISSDFNKFSYSVVKMILASVEEDGLYVSCAMTGNEASFKISDIDLFFSNLHVNGFLNSGFEDKSLIFDSLLTINDVSYKTNGLYSENMLSIYGDYGLNLSVLKDETSQMFKGSVKTTGLPIPIVNLLASIDTSFEFKNTKNWGVNFNQVKFEAMATKLSRVNKNFEFELQGNAKPDEIFFHSVKIGKRGSQLFGTASLNLSPESNKKTKAYSANIALKDIKEKEFFSFESLISVADRIYFDGVSKFENISLNRFFGMQKQKNKLNAEVVFLGSKDSISLRTDIKELNFRLNNDDLILNSILVLDDKQVSVHDTNINYGVHNITDLKAVLVPEDGQGNLAFDYLAELKKNDIKASVSFDFNSSNPVLAEEKGNIFKQIGAILSHYSIKMKVSDWSMGEKKSKNPVIASFVKEPGIMAIYAGANDSSYGFKTDDGIVSLHLDEELPLHLNIDGLVTSDEVNLNCTNIVLDIPAFMSYLPENDIVKFYNGILSGDLVISGTSKEPEFNGKLIVKKVRGCSPKYTPDNYGPADIPIYFSGTQMTIPYTVLRGTKDAIWAELNSEFIGWIPSETEILCGVINNRGLLETKNLAYHAKGRMGCDLAINITPNNVNLEGVASFDKGYFSVPFNELYKIGEKYQNSGDFSFTMNLKLNLGKNTEFRFPSTDFPILGAYIYTEEPLVLKVDSREAYFEMTGSAKIRTGELFYVKRNFHIKEGELHMVKTPMETVAPLISLVAEIRDKTPDGEPLTITLTAKDQYLDINKFSPKITSVPPMSDSETMLLLGKSFTGGSDKSNILKEVLINTSDVFAQMGLIKKAERGIRDLLHVDVFSARTLVVQNVVLGNLFHDAKKDKALTIGNYFDNTSVYIGKYFGSAIYADASLHLSNYDPLSAKDGIMKKKNVYGNLLFQPEIGLEMNTPFFLLRWHISPSQPDAGFVPDAGVTLSWKYSY